MSSREKRQQRAKLKKKSANIEKQKHKENQSVKSLINGKAIITDESIELYQDIPFPDEKLGHLKKLIQVYINNIKTKTDTLPEGEELMDQIASFNACHENYCFTGSNSMSKIELLTDTFTDIFNDEFINAYENAMQQLKDEGFFNQS
ncbi:hypothetical protein FHI74_18100 [Salmonella enterica subsp. enterica]|nr:hypothetical protein [Salmonella enterica subsp. enterica]EBD0328583.1 hypothetical protein [Salmonella enterica subsp. enterica]EBE4315652.1 hypothetical protein [Salmonella enterica subsp. enterica]EDG1339251.1 hypothetical protein [Salmonella enterica subsp. enterica serovar Muenchen]